MTRGLDHFILYNMVHFDEDDCRQPAIERAVYESHPELSAGDVNAALGRLEDAGLMVAQPSHYQGQAEVSWRVADFPRAHAAVARWRRESPPRRLSPLASR